MLDLVLALHPNETMSATCVLVAKTFENVLNWSCLVVPCEVFRCDIFALDKDEDQTDLKAKVVVEVFYED